MCRWGIQNADRFAFKHMDTNTYITEKVCLLICTFAAPIVRYLPLWNYGESMSRFAWREHEYAYCSCAIQVDKLNKLHVLCQDAADVNMKSCMFALRLTQRSTVCGDILLCRKCGLSPSKSTHAQHRTFFTKRQMHIGRPLRG